ncbi:hypothetical protein G7Y89_g10214 [Cudoniella acicularis]|uniref:F-box domain-containing protein n=1 Tax=Cudoniella acicularis TaxID=354080 RepID=A0A8H4RFY2_9HELO|nr:hypothetical protein G7Y89_g10214 [Cudoniella acicularis]
MSGLPLPSLALLDIISLCDVSTLKSLRLTRKAIRNLVDTYEISISTNIKRHSFTVDELASFHLHDGFYSELQCLFLLDYRVRTTRWLTDVALENLQEDGDSGTSYGNIGTNETQGDTVRGCVNTGWSILWRLSDIAHRVILKMTDLNPGDVPNRISSLTRGTPLVRELETAIKNEQIKYISSLSYAETHNYFLLQDYLAAVFHDRVFDDPRGKNSDWRIGNEFGYGNSWLNWLVLREGPNFFAKAWSSKEGNEECVKLITSEWSKRSKEQVLIEQAAAQEVGELVSSTVWTEPHSPVIMKIRLMDWARGGREIERVHRDVFYHLGRRLPPDVIRSIERDYSDYSS